LPSASNTSATPHHFDSPGAIVPRSFWNACFLSVPLQLVAALMPAPAFTLVNTLSAQLATSAPPIGAYTIVPPPGPVSVATVPL
jgi:hypothetical protein